MIAEFDKFVDVINVAPFQEGKDIDVLSRAAPGHPRLQRLLNYYREVTPPGRRMPARGNIDPSNLAPHLNTLFLLDLKDNWQTDDGAIHCRVVGTGLRDVLGCELTGRPITDMPFEASRRRICNAVRYAANQGQGYWGHRIIGGISLGDGAGTEPVYAESIILPLSEDDETVTQVLGEVCLIDPLA